MTVNGLKQQYNLTDTQVFNGIVASGILSRYLTGYKGVYLQETSPLHDSLTEFLSRFDLNSLEVKSFLASVAAQMDIGALSSGGSNDVSEVMSEIHSAIVLKDSNSKVTNVPALIRKIERATVNSEGSYTYSIPQGLTAANLLLSKIGKAVVAEDESEVTELPALLHELKLISSEVNAATVARDEGGTVKNIPLLIEGVSNLVNAKAVSLSNLINSVKGLVSSTLPAEDFYDTITTLTTKLNNLSLKIDDVSATSNLNENKLENVVIQQVSNILAELVSRFSDHHNQISQLIAEKSSQLEHHLEESDDRASQLQLQTKEYLDTMKVSLDALFDRNKAMLNSLALSMAEFVKTANEATAEALTAAVYLEKINTAAGVLSGLMDQFSVLETSVNAATSIALNYDQLVAHLDEKIASLSTQNSAGLALSAVNTVLAGVDTFSSLKAKTTSSSDSIEHSNAKFDL